MDVTNNSKICSYILTHTCKASVWGKTQPRVLSAIHPSSSRRSYAHLLSNLSKFVIEIEDPLWQTYWLHFADWNGAKFAKIPEFFEA